MKEPMIKRIDELFISEEAKETLKTVYGMSSSKHANIKSSIPSILVTADEGCGYSTFSKTYGDIISDSSLLKIRGVKTYIELVFPKDNERDEKMFFSSPLLASSIKNRFYGTMSISFKEFEGNDLIGSESFDRLMKFIAANRSNIYFVFHVLPEFSATKHLIRLLGNTLNISEVILDKPDKEKSFKYVMDGLKRQGYSINKADLNRFETLEKLKNRGVKLYRIDKQGTIIAYSDGKNITFNIGPSDDWEPGTIIESDESASTQVKEAFAEATLAVEEEGSDRTIPEQEDSKEITYVANTNTLKFHYPNCDSVKDMKEKNKWEVTISREELIEKGYKPCGRCKP